MDVATAGMVGPMLLEPPPIDNCLYAIHISQQRHADCPDSTPAVSAIVVQKQTTGKKTPFSAFRIGERLGLRGADIKKRLADLEREMLEEFGQWLRAVSATPGHRIRWLHWCMNSARGGFAVLEQRYRVHGLEVPEQVPPGDDFDLAYHFKLKYGPAYAPDPRFFGAIGLNGISYPGLLNEQQSAAAWQECAYNKLLTSLDHKVSAIACMYRLELDGEFVTAHSTPSLSQVRKSWQGVSGYTTGPDSIPVGGNKRFQRGSTERKPRRKRGGQAKGDPNGDAKLFDNWQAAKREGQTKRGFAASRNISLAELNCTLDRERKRRGAVVE